MTPFHHDLFHGMIETPHLKDVIFIYLPLVIS